MKMWFNTLFGMGIDAIASLRPAKGNNKRVLINEILSLQITITAIIGILAVAGLYWGGQWVLQGNYSRWAMQWTEELNENKASVDEYFILGKLCERIDELIAAKDA